LTIQAVPENLNGKQYTSARINTANTASWKYGKFQIRARLPKGDYLWPAIWMMPKDSVYGSWAASGEIDIVEARGQLPRVVEGTIHHGSGWPNNVYTGSGPRTFDVDFSDDFHLFELEWTRDQIQWLVDGKVYHTQNLVRNFYSGRGANPYNDVRQPFDQRFFMILNLAVGGGFFGGQANAVNQGIARGWPKPQMLIDYVRIYQQGGNPVIPNPVPVPSSQNAPVQSTVNTPAPTNNSGACIGKCGGGSCCDDQRNGAVCYDPAGYECASDSNGKKLLCGKGLGACNGVCFDTRNYICQSGRIAQKF
jgi:beta-glucanase (GH16 family)